MTGDRLRIVLFTTGRLGIDLAGAVARAPEVGAIHLITTELPGRRRPLWDRVRHTWRQDGPTGIARALAARFLPRLRTPGREVLACYAAEHCPGAAYEHWPDLHHPDALTRIRELRPDLAVVFGCYRLRRELFAIPRLGMLNLHLGKAPEFRGSSPGFYEMLAGVPEVGITVHRVDDGLDSGPILLQRCFPLDLAPEGDPVAYLQQLQRSVLVPEGARMMADVVGRVARGEAAERRQAGGGPARRQATWALKRELRRVVARRRAVDSLARGPISSFAQTPMP
jgi:folate-dependent phosphoribosylglycinamide formyltransferase PurN